MSSPATGPVANPPAGPPSGISAKPQRFYALRNRHSRPYLITSGLSMLGDNTEHVITYWVLWETFHSPALVGFQVISHWLPFLLFSVPFGQLAERYDCRKVIQAAQGVFMLVSLAWGVLFLTGSLQMWQACVLLVLHGCAGSLWGPAEQLMLHDFVERKDLPGAVRMNATFRSLGVLFGPAVGAGLLLVLGPTWGIFANVLLYLPMTFLMMRTPFTGHTRDDAGEAGEAGNSAAEQRKRIGMIAAVRAVSGLRHDRLTMSMFALSGLAAVTTGGALQAVMPTFANSLGAGTGLGYGLLLFATGAGAVLGGFLLEATGVLKPSVSAAVLGTLGFAVALLIFALTDSYVVALIVLVIAGVSNMASTSIGQSIVQLQATPAQRGTTFGAYGMFSSGLRVGNGITLGILGALVGIPFSMAVCSVVLVVGTLFIWFYARGAKPVNFG